MLIGQKPVRFEYFALCKWPIVLSGQSVWLHCEHSTHLSSLLSCHASAQRSTTQLLTSFRVVLISFGPATKEAVRAISLQSQVWVVGTKCILALHPISHRTDCIGGHQWKRKLWLSCGCAPFEVSRVIQGTCIWGIWPDAKNTFLVMMQLCPMTAYTL